jgi:hypothetical protein
MLKLSTAALEVPALVTVADEPGFPVVTVPTLTVAAEPADPVAPVEPVAPVGRVMSKTAALDVPTLVTAADEPGLPVVTVPTLMVAADPTGPASPTGPTGPAGPIKTAATIDSPNETSIDGASSTTTSTT